MLSKTPSTPVRSPAPGVSPDPITGPVSNGSVRAIDPDAPPVPSPSGRSNGSETRAEHFRRNAHRARLHTYAVLAVALLAFLVALAASNTTHVKANWVFGSSHVSLVWLVLFAAILGWLLGLATTAAFHWRTRAPRRGRATS